MKHTLKNLFYPTAFFLILGSAPKAHELRLQVEGASIWQTKNDIQIPSDSGTRFSLDDFTKGPVFGYRVYAGWLFAENHELRALFAPFSISTSGIFDATVSYMGQNFTSSSQTEAFYKFNSYRLSYRYRFYSEGPWNLWIGFTGKIRDAEIRLTQGATQASRTNVGFVPLLHFAASARLTPLWFFDFDMDAAAAPQGRAEDVLLSFRHQVWADTSFYLGYRLLEGGAKAGGTENSVYNFSFFQYATIGLHHRFL